LTHLLRFGENAEMQEWKMRHDMARVENARE